MNPFGCIHDLHGETVFIQCDAFHLFPVGGHGSDALIFLRKFFRRLCQAPSQPVAGIAHRIDERRTRARSSDGSQLGPESAAFAVDHVAKRAICVTVEQLFTVRGIALRIDRSFHFLAADISDDLPDLFIGHADALPVGAVRRHRRSGDPVADDLKHVRVGVRVLFLRAGKVRPAASAVSTQPVTEGAVNAELVLAGLCRLGIAGEWIAVIRGVGQSPQKHESDQCYETTCEHGSPSSESCRILRHRPRIAALENSVKSAKPRLPRPYMSGGYLPPALLGIYTEILPRARR